MDMATYVHNGGMSCYEACDILVGEAVGTVNTAERSLSSLAGAVQLVTGWAKQSHRAQLVHAAQVWAATTPAIQIRLLRLQYRYLFMRNAEAA